MKTLFAADVEVADGDLVAFARKLMVELKSVYPLLLEKEEEVERLLSEDEESTQAMADLTEARTVVMEEIIRTFRDWMGLASAPAQDALLEELEELEEL